MKKCLWVLPKKLFPVNDGARVANMALLSSISNRFTALDIAYYDEKESNHQDYKEYFNARNIYLIPKASFKNFLHKLLYLLLGFIKNPFFPVTVNPFAGNAQLKKIRQILINENYDVIIFDGLHPMGAFLPFINRNQTKVIYRAHNVEHEIWSTAASKAIFPLSTLLNWQGSVMQRFEMDCIFKSNMVWAISKEDAEVFLKRESKAKIEIIPVGLQFNNYVKKINSGKIQLLFLGKLDWAPNKDGLQWFLSEIWPMVNKDNLQLNIVGSGDGSWGAKLFKNENINFLGFVEDLDKVYQENDFSIIPIRFGSGTRIKVIESVSKKLPIISTQMGVLGSGLTPSDFLLAETANDWIKILSNINRDQGSKLSEAAFLNLRNIFDREAIAKKAYDSLE